MKPHTYTHRSAFMELLTVHRIRSLAILCILGTCLGALADNEPTNTPANLVESSLNGPFLAQEALLIPAGAEAADISGYSVAISADTAVVGTPYKNGNFADSGAAYVFVRDDQGWHQQAVLIAANPGTNDHFGCSVAIDGNTIVVGAENENTACAGADCSGRKLVNEARGAVYVFRREGTHWNQEGFLKPSNTGPNDHFGHAVSISSDTLVVGAHLEDSASHRINQGSGDDGAENAGASYVFVRQNGTWKEQAYLKASNSAADDQFGSSVSISGDTIVVGAPFEDSRATGVNGNAEDNGALQSGAAYVFVRTGATWSQQAYMKASNTANGDLFGTSVSVSGDTVVIGAPGETSRGVGVNGSSQNNYVNSTGAAYVFAREGTIWSQQAYLKAASTGVDDQFGYAVGIQGDLAVVGAWHEDSKSKGLYGDPGDDSLKDSGAVYAFGRRGKIWTQESYLKASDSQSGGIFGFSVAVSDNTVLVGSPWHGSASAQMNSEEMAPSKSGAAYVFAGFCPTCPRLRVSKEANGGAMINIIGIPGSALQLERATTLQGSWEKISTITIPDSGTVDYRDVTALPSANYYRTTQP